MRASRALQVGAAPGGRPRRARGGALQPAGEPGTLRGQGPAAGPERRLQRSGAVRGARRFPVRGPARLAEEQPGSGGSSSGSHPGERAEGGRGGGVKRRRRRRKGRRAGGINFPKRRGTGREGGRGRGGPAGGGLPWGRWGRRPQRVEKFPQRGGGGCCGGGGCKKQEPEREEREEEEKEVAAERSANECLEL